MGMIGCFKRVTDSQLDEVVANPNALEKFLTFEPEAADFLDVDKAWHGIHFLLTNSAWEGSGPLAFILHGGREIDQDLGYGPPHGFSSTEVKEIATELDAVDTNALFANADQSRFAAEEIYPEIWDEPKEDCVGYVTDYLEQLKKFHRRPTAEMKKGWPEVLLPATRQV